MGRLGRFFGRLFGDGQPAPRAGYDAAKTTDENKKHWREADGLAPVSQLTPGVRKTLRDRARYEVVNNCFAAGAVRTLVADTVGCGARLQMLTPDAKLNAAVEDLWSLWAKAADWALTTRIACGVEVVAGECFALPRESKRLKRLGMPVELDLRLIEPDQVADPFAYYLYQQTGDDGVVCDADGEVVAYKILRHHPGDTRAPFAFEADTVRAEDVYHWFQPTRPGQLRGVTGLAPAIPIFAQLRRFTSATLTAAEVAAMLAGVLEQQTPSDGGDYTVDQMDTVELVRGTLLTLPPGAKATQFKPEQPTTNYDMFVAAKLREIGRAINMPFGKIAGDHSSYNYSSGRLDDAPYWHDREIHRGALEAKLFDPFLYRWLDFAKFALPALAASEWEGRWWGLKHRWQYDARPTSDPVKDASGDELNLTNGADTLAAIAARDGTTVEDLLDQRAREKDMFEARGLPLPPWLVGGAAPARDTNGRAGAGTPTEAPANA